MITLAADNANQLFIALAQMLETHGTSRGARGLETHECNDDVTFVLTDPTKSIVTLPTRHTSGKTYQYLETEFRWYQSGNQNISGILPYAAFWKNLANEDGVVNSNYGFLILKQQWHGHNQLEWCMQKLKEDPETRQAVLNYNQPRHKYPNNKDFVCTVGQQFIQRNGKLDSIVWMRSSDLIYGLTYDLPWFTYVQQLVAEQIGLRLGKYTHMTTSLHVYQRHYTLLHELAAASLSPDVTHKANGIWRTWQQYTHGEIHNFSDSIAPYV